MLLISKGPLHAARQHVLACMHARCIESGISIGQETYRQLFCVQQETGLDTTMRSAIIELILGTDMKQHFTLVSRLQVTHAPPAIVAS